MVTAGASPAKGNAPLRVVLTAGGDAVSYHWELGDGATADGAQVAHVYAPGRYVAAVTATGTTGETARARVLVVARRQTVSLAGPRLGHTAVRP